MTKIDNFHGYQAVKETLFFNNIGTIEGIFVGVTNRVGVGIVYTNPNSLSEADADIEKFANAIDFNAIAMMENNNPSFARVETTNRPISLTAQYNPDGTITVTNNGGPGTVDLTIITVSVNGGTLRDKSDPQAGSTVTVQGIPARRTG